MSVQFQAVGVIVGVVVMTAGMVLFTRDQRTGENTAKVGPFEFKFSAPSLMIVAIGATIFAISTTGVFYGSGGDIHTSPVSIEQSANTPSNFSEVPTRSEAHDQQLVMKHFPAVSNGKSDWISKIYYCGVDRSTIELVGSETQQTLGPGGGYYIIGQHTRGDGEFSAIHYVVRERYDETIMIQSFLKKRFNISAAIIKDLPSHDPSDFAINVSLIGNNCPASGTEPPEQGQIVAPAPPTD